ncbi:N-terminal nucleophile aminohydrolase, partial [Hymenopellis radicata]
NDLNNTLDASLDSISHRGPDGRGIWTSQDGRVGQSRHVRLSIIDALHGAQPLGMAHLPHDIGTHTSGATGTDIILHCVVNGEIYDYVRIRAECEARGVEFRTASDSELVLGLYALYGIALLPHLRGEFAFVLYDQDRQLCFAARDRFGIKPLYYTFHDEVCVDADGKCSIRRRLLVASEIKAFLALGWKPEWNIESIVHQGEYGDDRTVCKGVYKAALIFLCLPDTYA